ncbi:MAG: Dam family site-specific DNA-(adenine-N6)-methyltransferase [Vampirovibrio sp.]|nr:Dam family site-specific DNA-(adenine-N6)-methyltransferase [Vampirovibrio sp.]
MSDGKPFLKWAGNKYRIMPEILAQLPTGKGHRRLIEPFAGSAAVFLNTGYADNIVADANADLIGVYQHLQSEGEAFIEFCRWFFTPENNCPEQYYEFRSTFNTTTDARLKAALFVYFNRHGYNGLCRYNQKGGFNVPFGKYKTPYFPEKEMKAFVAKVTLKPQSQSPRVVFQVRSFEDTMLMARRGDVVYCDPPYVPLTETANFTTYSSGGFGPAEQEQLAELAKFCRRQGATVLISNHDTPFTQDVYASAKITSLQVRRFISCNGSDRGKAKELLALFAG